MNWKKEYRLSDLVRRGEGETAAERPEDAPAGAEETTVWKKEIRLGGLFRRRKPSKQLALPQIGDTARDGVPATGGPAEAAPDPSIWKKEIKLSSLFRRRKATPARRQLALPAPGATVVDAPTPEASRAAEASEQPATLVPETPPETPEPPVAEAAAEADPAPETDPADPSPEVVAAVAAEPETAPAEASTSEAPALEEPAPPAEATMAGAPDASASEPAPEASETTDVPVAASAPKERFWKKEIGRKRSAESKPEKPARRARPERRAREESPKDDRTSRAESRGSKAGAPLPQVPLMKAVNLLPQDIKLPKTTLRPWVAQAAVGVVGLLVAGGMVFLFLGERTRVAERASSLEDARAELAVLEAIAQGPRLDADTGPQLEGEALSRATALEPPLTGRRAWDRLLRELSLTLPEDVWFSAMRSTATAAPIPAVDASGAPVVAPVQPADSVTIEGYALTQENVAHLLARLEVVPEFSSVRLESAVLTELESVPVIEFVVHGALKTPTQVTP